MQQGWKIGITGVTGSYGPDLIFTKETLENITNTIERYMKDCHIHHIVSGGAPGVDFAAIKVFLDKKCCENMTLCLPCEFDPSQNMFVETGLEGWKLNPGEYMNSQYKKFSQEIDHPNAMMLISQAIQTGANVKVFGENGFTERNREIAKSEILLAFTWMENEPAQFGGVRETWNFAEEMSNTCVHFKIK